MQLWQELRYILRRLNRRRAVQELDEEIRTHIELETQQNIDNGMSPEPARLAARRAFGGLLIAQEDSRAMWGFASLEVLWQDLRYGFRMLRKSPGFTTVVVLSLALGVGVNTAVFSFVNAVLFKPLVGVNDPDRLVWFRAPASYPDYEDYRDQNDVFSGLFASGGRSDFSLNSDGQPERISGELVTANYFSVLGVEAALGRTFLPEEDLSLGSHPIVVISHNLWQRRFGADLNIAGKDIRLNGLSATVVGVTPKGFIGKEAAMPVDIWVPMVMYPQLRPSAASRDTNEIGRLNDRNTHWLHVVGRLKPGVSLKQAEAAMTGIAERVAEAHQSVKKDERLRAVELLSVSGGLDPRDRLEALPLAGMLMAIVGLVLLTACANVASLLLARASLRQREIALRQALGASRSRLIRQLLTEAVMLSLLGGVVGLLLASWSSGLLLAFSRSTPIANLDISLDYRVLAFTLLTSLLAGIIFGLAPALQTSRPDLLPAIKNDSAILVRSSRRYRLRNLFVIAQVMLSLVLLVGAGLFIRSLQNARAVNPGFNAENGLLVPIDLALLRYSETKGQAFYRQLIEQVKTLPGVEEASLMRFVPLGLSFAQREIVIAGSNLTSTSRSQAGFNIVGSAYFQTMGIPLLSGREFSDQDRDGALGVVIVNETLAQQFWPGENPIGKQVSFGSGPKDPHFEIIGVASDGKYSTLGESPRPFIYQPLLQNYEGEMTLVVSTATDPAGLTEAVREKIRALDNNLPVADVKTLAEQVSFSLFPARVGAMFLGVFGLLALVLAVTGVYGVVSYTVSQRTQEIGIRIALGARSGDVFRLVIRQGMLLVIVGIVLGLAASLAVTRLVSNFLYGLSATDLITFVGVSLLLMTVALMACFLPARRATKVDPMIALRYE
jgi:macrolide transport system ATP-binding/permease protein